MESNPYQLYAFEFYVQNLKTDVDLADLRVEVRLFQTPYAVINSKMDFTQSMWVLNSHDVPSEKEAEDEERVLDPFTLDFKSMTTIAEAEEGQMEDEESSMADRGNREAQKMASYDPCAPVETVNDGSKKQRQDEAKVNETALNNQIPEDVKESSPEHQESGTRDSISLEDNRSQLRMFPEDPTGMPYNKIRKEPKPPVEENQNDANEKNVNGKGADLGGAPTQKSDDVENKTCGNDPSSYSGAGDVQREPHKADENNQQEVYSRKKSDKPTHPVMKDKEKITAKTTETLPSDIFESGVTIVLPMKPLTMIHNLQRIPLHVKVCNEGNGLQAEAFLDLWPLFECAVRAERGPPTPVTSSCGVTLHAYGDFEASLRSIVRLHAFGHLALNKIKSKDENPNDEMNHSRAPERPQCTPINNDIHKAPPVVTGPEAVPRADPRRRPPSLEEETILASKQNKNYYSENIVFCPVHRLVTPQPNDNYETLRWKIDKLLGVTEVSVEEYKVQENDEKIPVVAEDKVDDLQEWLKNRKREQRSRWNTSKKKYLKTRSILQKIMMGLENPEPIRSCPDVIGTDLVNKEDEEDEENSLARLPTQSDQPTEQEIKINKTKFIYDEIRRQQNEEMMLKRYKRVFRLMLRKLEMERGTDPGEQRRREKGRKYLKDLLSELETYSAEDVEIAFIKVIHEKKTGTKRKKWELDTWSAMEEEEEDGGEEEDHLEEEEEGHQETGQQNAEAKPAKASPVKPKTPEPENEEITKEVLMLEETDSVKENEN